MGGAVMQLWRSLDADLKSEGGIDAFGGGVRLPCLILHAVLRHTGGELANTVGIVDVDGDGSRLPDHGRG